jgi:hypothetical protein
VERLFDTGEGTRGQRTSVPATEAPLAVRMRPRSLDEVVGQPHLLADGSPLRVAVETGERPHRRRGREGGVRGGVGRERRAS